MAKSLAEYLSEFPVFTVAVPTDHGAAVYTTEYEGYRVCILFTDKSLVNQFVATLKSGEYGLGTLNVDALRTALIRLEKRGDVTRVGFDPTLHGTEWRFDATYPAEDALRILVEQ